MTTLTDPHTGRRTRYGVARSPRDGLWYVIADCGRSRSTGRYVYMPMGHGHGTRADALAAIPGMHRADCESRAGGIDDLESLY